MTVGIRPTVRRRAFGVLLLALALLVPAVGGRAKPEPSAAGTTSPGSPPNIVLILTDDLDARSVAMMPNVQALLAEPGATFSRFFVTTPLCCPSRASLLRGQYAHNHGVLTNTGENGGFPTFLRRGNEASTIATWLDAAGYRTALFGKYLNRYPKGAEETHVPPGWDEWDALSDIGADAYVDFDLNENGTIVAYGDAPDDYLTDVLAAKAVAFAAAAAASDRPFFVYLAPYAPHSPSTAAPRHAEAFAEAAAPRVPSFNEADVADKPAWLRALPPLTAAQIEQVDEHYRKRLRSLLAVDEMVAALVGTLQAAGQLDNTYLVFTSDNGFHVGEHRLPLGKQTAYEESIRVPLIVRGPGIPALSRIDALALNIDLAPTFAEWAGAPVPDFVDGRSLAPLLRGERPPSWREAALIEEFATVRAEKPNRHGASKPAAAPTDEEEPNGISPAAAPPYLALRTVDLLYVAYDDGERELYDLRADPYELENLARSADPALIARLDARLAALRECAAAGCRAAEDAPLDDGGG